MNADRPYNDKQSAREELGAISPILGGISKPTVPMPNDAYFGTLADKVLLEGSHRTSNKKRTFKLIPMGLVSLAAAACITAAIIFWPGNNTNNNFGLAFDSLTNDELLQLAMQDEALLDNHIMEDDSLLVILAANSDFQYLSNDSSSDEYNKLLLEMIDDETLMEDWL
jgi:hypothetical protein